jgi:SAM-dependent methyltransferase
MSLFGIGARVREREVMDDPNLNPVQHERALQGLSRLNAISRSTRILWRPIVQLARQKGGKLRVLDVATGAGEVLLDLWQKASRAGIRLEILGTDVNPHAVELARERAAQRKIPVDFSVCDAVTDELPSGFDVVISSLFFHHLAEDQAATLLQKMADAACHLVLVNDLHRSRTGLVLVATASRVITTSRVVHVDAVRSVRAAFTVSEMRLLADVVGLEGATVEHRWPCRFLLSWERR